MQIFNFNRKPSKAASDFWMADSYEMKSRKKDEDVMELSSYRRAVANFVRIVTGENIPVLYSTGTQSSANGKTVTISASTKLEERDSMVGLALHEGSHIKLTDFKLVNETFSQRDMSSNIWINRRGFKARAVKMLRTNGGEWDEYYANQYFKDVFNYVEDRRIDNFVMTQAPGYMPYYQALYDRYFNNSIVTKGLQSSEFRDEKWDSYQFRLMNITNPASDLKALKGLQKIWDMLDLEHVDRLKNSEDSLMLAFDILETIHDSIQKSKQEQQQKEEQKKQKEQDKQDKKNQDQKNRDQKDKDQKDKDSKGEEGSGESSDDDDGDSNDESNSKNDDKKEKKEKSDKKDKSDSKDDPKDSGEGEEDGSEGSGGLEEESEDESESNSDSDSDSDGDEDEGDDGEGKGSGEGEDDDEGEDSEGESEGEDGEEEEEEEQNVPELSKSDRGRLMKQITEQKSFQSGNIKKKNMAKSTADMINAIDDSDVSIESVTTPTTYGNSTDFKVTVVRKFTRRLAETTSSNMWTSQPVRSFEDAVSNGIRMGTVLGKKLKVRAEERSTKFNRLRSGRIDKRMISQAGFGAEGIFEKIESFAYRPGIIHLSIDGSGSMSGDKFKRSLTCAAAIAKACSMIENLDCVISFRSTGSVGNSASGMAMIVVAYDSTKQSIAEMKTLLPFMTANGGTPEGLCFDATMKDILAQAKGKDAYFVNFSDGAPYHSSNSHTYSGEIAYNHTRKQVNKMKANGMKVLSYFISESGSGGSDRNAFERMYGKDAQFINVKSINEVAKTLNAKFLEINNQ